VDKERKVLPQLGGKKLYHQIQPHLQSKGIKMGRDKLFKLLDYYNLLIKPKRRYIQTTMSKHWLRKYPNLYKEQTVTRPEQVWVSDITYIKTDEGTCYLNLVTDAYSRKIMGYAIADSMDTTSMKKAFEMAVKDREYPSYELIHHSDRGLQYCSQEYVQIAVANNIKISMTEQSDPYENALAERMNRTLKDEFGLGQPIKTKQHAFHLAKEAIHLYNHYRPHLSLKMKTPNQTHETKIPTTKAIGTI
jgi:transposase InsO family protein